MPIITDLQRNKSRKRVNVFLDGSLSFTIDRDVVAEAGLSLGQDLSKHKIEELREADQFRRCFNSALSYLAYRPRSEAEIKMQLLRRAYVHDIIHKVIIKLKEQGLIDDLAFAQYWKDNRLSFSPRSRRLIKQELRQKGVAVETIDEAIEDLNDEFSAYKAGQRKVRTISTSDYAEFHRRLSNYLRWQGFNYAVIESVSVRLWEERQTAAE
jgi:regulatory protein